MTIGFAGFALGATLLLAAALACQILYRQPLARVTAGDLAARGLLAFAVLFAVPLPRWTPDTAPPVERSPPPIPTELRSRLASESPAQAPRPPIAPAPENVGAPLAAVPAPLPLPVEAPPPRLSITDLCVVLWAAGAALVLLRLACGALLLHLRLARLPKAPPEVRRAIAARAWPTRPLRLLVAPAGSRPFCAGIRRPTLVLPADLLEPRRRSMLRHVLHHELAHLANRDPARHLLLACAAVPLWWHPLFWWLARNTRLATEVLADEAAVTGRDRASYVRALLDLAASRQPAFDSPLALAASGAAAHLERRTTMLLDRRKIRLAASPLFRTASAALAVLLTSAAVLAFGARTLPAQDPVERTEKRAAEVRVPADLDALRAERAALLQRIAELEAALEKMPRVRWDGPNSIRIDRDGDGRYEMVSRLFEHPGEPGEPPGAPMLADVPLLSGVFEGTKAAPAPREPLRERSGTNVLELVSRAIEIDKAVQIASHTRQRTEQLRDAGHATDEQLLRVQLDHESGRREQELLRVLIASEIAAIEHEIAALRGRKAEPGAEAQLARLVGHLKVLRALE